MLGKIVTMVTAALNAVVPGPNMDHIFEIKQKYLHKKGLQAIEYCINHPNTYTVHIFPMAKQDDDKMIKKILKHHGNIIHSKKLYLTNEGPLNYLRFIYDGHGAHQGKWLGSAKNNFKGARQAAKERFSTDKYPLRVYLFECNSVEIVKRCKRYLRKYIGATMEAVHANDTHQETIKIANVIFDDDEIEKLNS